jgi:hypothetical protein
VNDSLQIKNLIAQLKANPNTASVVHNKSTLNKSGASTQKYIQALQTELGLNADGIAGPKTLQALQQRIPDFNGKLNVNDSLQIKNLIAQLKVQPNVPSTLSTIISSSTATTPIEDTMNKEAMIKTPVEIPMILKSRVNKLVNTITVNEKNIIVDYYDNGEIDGDVISVYNNNKLAINSDTLSAQPIRLHIQLDENNNYHELITVAENLGRIPPNTCLMIITAGKQRFEFPMSSDKQHNAKVIITYQPKEGTKISQQH